MDARMEKLRQDFENKQLDVDEPFHFHCTICGKCCINREDILLTPKDLYNLARELHQTPEAVFDQYCECYVGADSRLPVVRLKPQGSVKRCPMLKDRKCLGGTSAEKLAKLNRTRPDGMSLSRTAELHCGKNADFLFVAKSGPGETNKTGLIVPKFGGNPENHVAVSMAWDTFAGFMLTTKAHYEAWLAAWYAKQDGAAKPKTQPKREPAPPQPSQEPEYSIEPEYEAMPMF